MADLEEHAQKRDVATTPEKVPKARRAEPVFLIQKHDATA